MADRALATRPRLQWAAWWIVRARPRIGVVNLSPWPRPSAARQASTPHPGDLCSVSDAGSPASSDGVLAALRHHFLSQRHLGASHPAGFSLFPSSLPHPGLCYRRLPFTPAPPSSPHIRDLISPVPPCPTPRPPRGASGDLAVRPPFSRSSPRLEAPHPGISYRPLSVARRPDTLLPAFPASSCLARACAPSS